MCGHVGIAGNLELKDENTLKKLLMFDYFRGTDSTGLAALKKNGDTKIAKIASHPIDLFDTAKYKEAANAYNSTVFIGHNRAATKGAVNGVNAHPYDCGHIVGAHNGTLTTTSWDKLQEMIGEKTGTDSHAIFLAIEKFGIDETVKHLQGAWALVWFDKNENTLNFLRNKERPFWYSMTKDFKKLFWSSEHWMMRAAQSSGTYEMYQSDDGYGFWSTKEDWHYRYDLDALAKGSDERPSVKAKVKELKGKEPEPVKQVGYHQNFPARTPNTSASTTGSSNRGNSTTTSHGTRTSTGSSNPTRHLMHNVSSDDPQKPFGDSYPLGRFKHIANYGCSWCQKPIDIGDANVVVFDSQEKILCSCCGPKQASGNTRIYLSAAKMAQAA